MKPLAFLIVLLVPALASAQGHPCDVNPGLTFTVTAGTITVKPCWAEQDLGNNPAMAVQWGVIIDAVRSVVPMTKVTQTANAAGLFQFSGTTTLGKGPHSLSVDVCIDDGAGGVLCTPIASPLAVKAKGPGPKAPVNVSVQ